MSAATRMSPRLWHSAAGIVRVSPATAYVARTLLAMAIAFHAALWLQLSSPASSMVTVMIVASLSRGAILSKGFWRIFGTVMGAAAAVVITAWFGQTPILFLVAFGAWLGLCTFISSLFRHFRAYGAVLAGYTVALIAAGAIANPEHVLDYALARLAVVTLGVVVSTVVTMIFQPSVTTNVMRSRARASLRGVAKLLLSRADGVAMDDPAFVAERTRLAGDIERLDETVEFSGAEATDVNRHAASIRRGLAALYAALLSVSVAGQSLNRLTMAAHAAADRDETAGSGEAAATAEDQTAAGSDLPLAGTGVAESLSAEVRGLLQDVAAYDPQDRHAAIQLSERIATVARDVTRVQGERGSLDEVTTLARIHQELEQLHDCVAPFAAWQETRRPYHRGSRLRSFHDYPTAIRNGVRAAIAVLIGGFFIYFTGWWPAGPTALIILAASCGLLSNAPSAAAASIQFGKGITYSSVVAFIYAFWILPHITGYPMMFASLVPVLAVAIYGSTIPRFGLLSVGFVIFFLTQINFANQMNYDIVTFTNNTLAFTLGAWATVLAFRVVWPPNPMRDASHLTRRIRRATERLIRGGGRHRGRRDWLGWLVTYNQAMQRLFLRLQVNPSLRNQTIGDCGALLIITQEALRLQSILRGLDLPQAERTDTEMAIRHLMTLRRPQRATLSAERASALLQEIHARSETPRPGLLRAAGSFRTIAALMPQAQRMLSLEAPFPKDA